MENSEKKYLFADRQNFRRITRITATHVSDVTAVLNEMQKCEAITLTDDQVKMGLDIDASVVENNAFNAVRVAYLVRYGMLLEMRNH